MALTRKFLSALGIEADKIDEIIAAHTETINGLKDQADQYKADAEQLQAVRSELDALKAAAEDGNPFEAKYNELKAEFDQYKADQDAAQTKRAKEAAYTDLLRNAGISDKRFGSILRVTDLGSVELDEEGKIVDADKLAENIKTEWSDFVTTTQVVGANTANPPSNSGGAATMTRDEILAIKDKDKRQKAIADNHELFGF